MSIVSRERARVSGVSVALVLFVWASARAETVPVRGLTDSRIRTAVYDVNDVYRLHGHVGYEIDLQFGPGESFAGLGGGDLDGLSFVAQDNHLFIKPKASQVSTNLTVLTNRRVYQFQYTVSASRADDPDAIFAVRFIYAGENDGAAAADPGPLLGHAADQRPTNIDYWYCGSPSLKPAAASDDGVHTRLRFGAKAEQPAIFIRNDDGTESLLNFSTADGDIVIHRVVRELVVRRGRLVGLIINKAFSGSGERLDSGTVSPDVRRAIGERGREGS